MNVMKRTFVALFAALALLCAAIPAAFAATVYEDGSYTASLTFEGGTGRIVWNSPVAVTVEGGVLYADLVMSKPGGDTPSVEWMEYNGVRYTAQVDANAKTCSFYRVPVTDPARMAVSANTTAMSSEHVVDYTLHLNVSAIPTVSESSSSVSQPAQEDDTPKDAPLPEDEEFIDPETADEEMVILETDDGALDGDVLTTGALPESESSSGALSVPAIIAIAAGGVIVLGGGAYLLLRRRKSNSDEA